MNNRLRRKLIKKRILLRKFQDIPEKDLIRAANICSRNAIRTSKLLNRSIIYAEGNKLMELFPNGDVKFLKLISENPSSGLRKGMVLSRK